MDKDKLCTALGIERLPSLGQAVSWSGTVPGQHGTLRQVKQGFFEFSLARDPWHNAQLIGASLVIDPETFDQLVIFAQETRQMHCQGYSEA